MAQPSDTERDSLDPSAWVDAYGDYLYRYALSRLREGNAAEEVVQETFLAGLRNVEQFSGKGAERAWLLGILKRKIIDFIRQRNKSISWTDACGDDPAETMFDQHGGWKKELRSTVSQPLDSLERGEFWNILRGCLQHLPLRQADVFVLREVEECGTAEICKELEISPSNLWVLLHRARLRLALCMKNQWK